MQVKSDLQWQEFNKTIFHTGIYTCILSQYTSVNYNGRTIQDSLNRVMDFEAKGYFLPISFKRIFFHSLFSLWLTVKICQFSLPIAIFFCHLTTYGEPQLWPFYKCWLCLNVSASFTNAVKNRYFPFNICCFALFAYSFILVCHWACYPHSKIFFWLSSWGNTE